MFDMRCIKCKTPHSQDNTEIYWKCDHCDKDIRPLTTIQYPKTGSMVELCDACLSAMQKKYPDFNIISIRIGDNK